MSATGVVATDADVCARPGCGHEREVHFEFGCGSEVERDVCCECTVFVEAAEKPPCGKERIA